MELQIYYFHILIITSYSYASCPSRWPPNGKLQRQVNLEAVTEDPIFGLDPAKAKKKDRTGENIWILQSYLPHYYFNGFLISVTDIGPANCGNSSLISLNDQSKTWTGCKKVLRNTQTKHKSFMPFLWVLPKCGCAVLRATVIAKHHYYYLENENDFDGPLAKTICRSVDMTTEEQTQAILKKVIPTQAILKKLTPTQSINEFINSVINNDEFPEDSNAINMKLDISYIKDPMIEENNPQTQPKTGLTSIPMLNIANKINQSCLLVLDDNNNYTTDEQNNDSNTTCFENYQEMRNCCILSQMERFKCVVDLKNRHVDELCNNSLPLCAWQWDSWNFKYGQHKCCQETGTERYSCFNQTFWIQHEEALDSGIPSSEITTTNEILNSTLETTSSLKKNQVDDTEDILRSQHEDNKVDVDNNLFNDKSNQLKDEVNQVDQQSAILNRERSLKQYNDTAKESKNKEEETKSDGVIIQSNFYQYCCRNGMEASSDIKILGLAVPQCQELSETFYREISDLVNYEIECQKIFKSCCIKQAMKPMGKKQYVEKRLTDLFK